MQPQGEEPCRPAGHRVRGALRPGVRAAAQPVLPQVLHDHRRLDGAISMRSPRGEMRTQPRLAAPRVVLHRFSRTSPNAGAAVERGPPLADHDVKVLQELPARRHVEPHAAGRVPHDEDGRHPRRVGLLLQAERPHTLAAGGRRETRRDPPSLREIFARRASDRRGGVPRRIPRRIPRRSTTTASSR